MTERRTFLKKMAAGGAVLAAAAADPWVLAAQAATGAAAPAPGQAQTPQWDDTWATALANAKYRAVIDAPEMRDGDFFWHATAFFDGCTQALGATDEEIGVAIVIRHAAIAAAYNDVIWSKYDLGKRLKVKDPATNKPAKRNPFLMVPEGVTTIDWMRPTTITALAGKGVTFPCCNRATRFLASQIAGWSAQERGPVYEELKANLVPGARLQPTGLYATMRAQQVGAAFMRP